MTILASPAEATSDWLSGVLGSSVEITANEPIADAGIVSPVARLRIESNRGPNSVIVKCAPTDDVRRARVNSMGLLKTEAFFYRDIEKRAGVPVPHCWFSEFRESDGRCTIVMEDLDPLVPGNNEDGLTFEQASAGLRLLVSMHARHWGRVEVWPWLAERTRLVTTALGAAAELVPSVLDRYGDRFPPTIQSVLDDLDTAIRDPAVEERTAANTTLVHGDFHAANLAFGNEPDEVKVFDWQLAMAAPPGMDLVKLVVNALTTESFRLFGGVLLEAYRDGMTGAGVPMSERSLQEFVHDALFLRLGATVRIASTAVPGSYPERWVILCMDRMAAALDAGW